MNLRPLDIKKKNYPTQVEVNEYKKNLVNLEQSRKSISNTL